MSTFTRRELMKALGLSATALGLPTMLSSRAQAQERPPLRFVVFCERHGYAKRFARPRRPGQGDWADGAATAPGEAMGEWALAPAFEPLEGYEDRIINLVGMDMRSANLPNATADNGGHGHLQSNALTAAPRVSHNTPGGPSIDQFVADGLVANGIVTRVRSIAVDVSAESPHTSPIYQADGTNVRTMIQPPNIYDALFPAELQAGAEERARLARRRTATGNLIQSLGSSLVARLSTQQRDRVNSHMQAHRDLQERLATSGVGMAPDRATILGAWNEPIRYLNARTLQDLGFSPAEAWSFTQDVNTRLVAAALHADVTRVAVICSDWLPNAAWDFTPGDGDAGAMGTFGSLNNHGFHHEVEDAANLGDRGDQFMIRYHQETTRTLRMFLDRLGELTEADGSSVLDNTIVLHATEMADPGHRWQNCNWSVIGNAQGRFRTGRTITFDRTSDSGSTVPAAEWVRMPTSTVRFHQTGPSHGQLLTTMANAMGIETNTFGEPSICPGPIDLS